ncbi:MAG: hypothetical protein ACJAV7_001993, partial [Flavobacteriales bacterium]
MVTIQNEKFKITSVRSPDQKKVERLEYKSQIWVYCR